MVPWHPDRHASATSPSLLKDDQNLRDNRVTVQWRRAGCRASPYRHPGCHANVVPPGLRSPPLKNARLSGRLKLFHRHFSTNFKSFSPPKICTRKSSFFTARLCRGGHANRFSLSWVEMGIHVFWCSSQKFEDGPNTVSESTVSDTKLRESCCPHRVPERELSEFHSAYYLCAEANSPSFSQNSPSLALKLSEAQWVTERTCWPKAFCIYFSPLPPISNRFSNLSSSALKRDLLKRHLTLSETSKVP